MLCKGYQMCGSNWLMVTSVLWVDLGWVISSVFCLWFTTLPLPLCFASRLCRSPSRFIIPPYAGCPGLVSSFRRRDRLAIFSPVSDMKRAIFSRSFAAASSAWLKRRGDFAPVALALDSRPADWQWMTGQLLGGFVSWQTGWQDVWRSRQSGFFTLWDLQKKRTQRQ